MSIWPHVLAAAVPPSHKSYRTQSQVLNLSGGELQRVAITICLGVPADIYLIDEPSAYLDSEQRISASKVIKRFILHAKKTAFIVEHDFIMATYLADRVVVYEGVPARKAKALSYVAARPTLRSMSACIVCMMSCDTDVVVAGRRHC